MEGKSVSLNKFISEVLSTLFLPVLSWLIKTFKYLTDLRNVSQFFNFLVILFTAFMALTAQQKVIKVIVPSLARAYNKIASIFLIAWLMQTKH